MELTFEISEDSSKAFFGGIVPHWCLSGFFILRQKALPCCAAVGFPFLLRARRCRCVTLKPCAFPQVFVVKPSLVCNWLCQLWTSVLCALKSQTAL